MAGEVKLASAVGARSRWMLLGSSLAWMPRATNAGIDYDNTTVFEIDIPEPNRTFRFGYATSMTAGAPLGGLIDWGDGTTTELKTLAYSNAYYFYQTSTSDYAGALGTHTYAQAGRYTIRVTGDVKQLNPLATQITDADVGPAAIVSASFKRTNAAATSSLPFAMTNAVMTRLTHVEYIDVSRVYLEGDTARRTVPAPLASPNIVLKRIYYPRVDYLGAAFMTDNTHTKDVHFTMNTMDDVFNFKTTPSGTTKWNFAEVDKGVVFHCKDGDIQWEAESGEWKGFLK